MIFQKNFSLTKLISVLALSLAVHVLAAIPTEKLPPRPVGKVTYDGSGKIIKEQPNYIYDENRVMSTTRAQWFNNLSDSLYKHTNVALALAIVNDIENYDVREYALEVARYWGVGGETNEGVFILVALKQRKFSTEIGTGAEGYLPDLLVHKLQQEDLVPNFKASNYDQGILAFAYDIANVVAKEKGENLNLNQNLYKPDLDFGYSIILLGMFISFVVIIIKSRSKRKGLLGTAVSSSTPYRGGSFGGGFGGGSFGSSRGSFSSNSSSRGFGGGGFGGGGSSGSW